MSIKRVHAPFFRLYFLASLVTAHRQPMVAPLSALVECMDVGFPSIGPSPSIFVVILVIFVIIHTPVPLPCTTDASEPPINVPFLRSFASSAMRP